MTEHEMQASLFAEIDLRANQDARWGLCFAIPNGQYRPGQRMEPGLRAGVPDLCLPVPRAATYAYRAYHGLFLELKVPGQSPRKEQAKWLNDLVAQGYYATWVNDADEAIRIIAWYLDGEKQ